MTTMTKKLGVLGGTFDPPHNGHLTLARTAYAQLNLEGVLFVLAGHPPHKPNRPVTSEHCRLAMVEAAIADTPAFAISRVDVERPGPHYTVDMLTLLNQAHPQAEFFFLMGGDSLAQFAGWRDPVGILRQARLAVMRRPGWRADVAAIEQTIPQIRERLLWLDAPSLDIASSDLRKRIWEGLSIQALVPLPVARYIGAHDLYRGDAQSSASSSCVNSSS